MSGIMQKNLSRGCIMDNRNCARRVISVIVAAAAAVVTILCFVLMLSGSPGMNIAFFMALVFSFIVITFLLIRALRANEKYARIAKALQRCFVVCLVVGLAGFLTLQGLIMSAASTQDAEVDCIIVLGAGLHGEIPSRTLVSRLDSAIEYLGGRDNTPIIVSGGQGSGETITEAEAMFRYLNRNGIDENQIWQEGKSTSTLENLAFSKDVMEQRGLDTDNVTIAIVTNEFHLYRAKHIAGSLGLDVVGVAAETPYPSLRVLYHFREAVAIMNSFVFGCNIQ